MQAYPQAYAAQANKGTLMPGQTIAVNKYTVQVERYLSQGALPQLSSQIVAMLSQSQVVSHRSIS